MIPAAMDATRCTCKPSFIPSTDMHKLCLMLSYEPNWEDVRMAARLDVTAQPLYSPVTPGYMRRSLSVERKKGG